MKEFQASQISCKEKISSEDYWDFIFPPNRSQEVLGVDSGDMCMQEMDFDFYAAYVNRLDLEPLTLERYWYNSIPDCYSLLDMEALEDAGITAVQNYPTLKLLGENVMIGFVDTGINYSNPIFFDSEGKTRIVGIWDQTIQTGTPPEGLEYGSAYTEEEINRALRAENPLDIVPSEDLHGHGTFLASVAAGGADLEQQFLGAAPAASIAVVKLKEAKKYLKDFYAIREDALCYQENDIMLGLKYLNHLAQQRKMPLVICIALGTNFGGHNGTTPLSLILDFYSRVLNRSVVIGTGNEAAKRHHYYHRFADRNSTSSAEIRVGNGVTGFVTELWSALPNVVTLSITSPSGERTRQVSLRQGYRYHFVFTFERTEVDVEYRLFLENNDSQLIFMRFHNPAPGIWRINVEPIQMSEGEYHMWLPMEEFLSGEVYFLEANPDNTLTEPGTSRHAMTVAYYNSDDNAVDINSGRGYTRDGIIKPDFAAPGVNITGAGIQKNFVTRSSSSAATGITAGAVALLLEWIMQQPGARGVSASQIRTIIVLGANRARRLSIPMRSGGMGRWICIVHWILCASCKKIEKRRQK